MKLVNRLAFLLIVLLFAGCTGRHVLKVEQTNFEDQIDQLQNLEFTFNRDVAPDTIIELWDTVNYIEFEPAIKGKFKWANKRQLVFSPSGPFAPNTDYTAKCTDLILKLSTEPYKFEEPEVLFHTPYLAIDNAQAYYSRNESFTQQLELRVKLLFNCMVQPNEVKKYISLKVNGVAKPFRLVTSENSNEMELAIAYDPDKDPVKGIEVTMGTGMKAIGSARLNKEAVSTTIPVPASTKLEVTDVTTSFEEGQGVITVFTSQPVVTQGLKGLVGIDPAVEFEIAPISNGFRIEGNFGDGRSYQLTLNKSIKGIFGPELGIDQVQTVSFGSLKPYIAFADQTGMYLASEGSGNLGIKIINVPKIKITVFKIYENNIQHYLRNGKNWDWYSDGDNYYENYAYGLNEDYGKVISTREYYTSALHKQGNIRLLHINPRDLDLSSELKGIYLIKAESPDMAWLYDVQLLSYSDIGLIVKQGSDEVFVAARSIATAAPLEGVSLSFYSSNNQVVHKLATGKGGIAVFKDLEKTIPGFKISMVSARKGDDFNVLLYNKSAVENSRFDVGGKRTAGLNYDAFIYGDRNLYRPGDSVHINAILRDFKWSTITGFPVKYRVLGPDGKDFIKRRLNVNRNGAASLSFALPVKALTGTYICEVMTVNDVLIGNYRIKVEEFMPDRIDVDVTTNKAGYLPGDILQLSISAVNFFGPPAANRKVENELRLNRKGFMSKKFKNYNFSLTTSENLDIMTMVNQTITSADGKALQNFQLPEFRNVGLLEGKVFTTVFDETGRPVNRFLNFNLLTQNTFLGMLPLPGWVSTGKPVDFRMIALNSKEKPVSAIAKIEVINVLWETVLERNYGQTTYRSQRKEKLIMSKQVAVSSAGTAITFIPPTSGEYIVRLSLPVSNAFVEESFFAYKWGDTGESTFKVNRDGEVDITFDKQVYQPGQQASILFKTPFAGELLVTVEQNKVLEYHIVKATDQGASLKLKVKDEFLPNAYITATLLRKTTEAGIPLTVAHGFASMKVEKAENHLPVTIISPDHIRSGVRQPIKIKTAPGAEVTVAVVDEGILQITDYKTPDPYTYFYQKRALEVTAYDLFDELFPELSTKRSSSGGDQGFDLGKRLNPLTAKRVKLLSLWSDTRIANASGEVTFIADIPEFSGTVRIMAVTYKDSRFGSAAKQMKIADPVTISSSVPRFLSPGDQADVYVTMSNTTNKPMETSLETSVTAPLLASGLSKQKVTLKANSETQVTYRLTAQSRTGVGNVTFKVKTAGETFTEKIVLPVRAATPLVKKADAGVITAGKSVTISSTGSFIKGTGDSRLLLTTNPAGRYAHQLDELVNYPYGCIEQTISAAFPQLYFEDLARMLKKGTGGAAYNTTANVNEAIRKIAAFQQYNGGLVIWPEGGEVNWWNSAYAAHFLYEAQRAGFNVDKQVEDNLHKYLLEMVKQKGTATYYYKMPGNSEWQKKVQPQREIFYSLYVLALNGKHHLPTMNYYKTRINELTTDSRYLLASAFKLAGDTRSYNTIVPKTWGNEQTAIMSGGSYSSPLRDRAIALYTLLTADENNLQIPVLARQVGEMIDQQDWMSTQERAFSMMALGKLAHQAKQGNITAQVTVGGTRTYGFKGDNLMINTGGNKTTLTTKGAGKLFWYLESEGIPTDMQTKEEDRVLRVRRQMFTRQGQKVNSHVFNQNELLVMAVTISTVDNSKVENVVVTDILPACFEIENARLTADRGMEWIKNRAVPDYLDMRDDRINFFTSASSEPLTYYYLVRVVNKGNFTQGPVGAEAMYNGQYYSYWGKSAIKVN